MHLWVSTNTVRIYWWIKLFISINYKFQVLSFFANSIFSAMTQRSFCVEHWMWRKRRHCQMKLILKEEKWNRNRRLFLAFWHPVKFGVKKLCIPLPWIYLKVKAVQFNRFILKFLEYQSGRTCWISPHWSQRRNWPWWRNRKLSDH